MNTRENLHNNKIDDKDISLIRRVFFGFILSIIVISGITASIVFIGWISSTNKHTEQMAMDLNGITIEHIAYTNLFNRTVHGYSNE